MSNLQQRQEKIQVKRKNTPWRQYLMEICSCLPLVMYKDLGNVTRYPDTNRKPQLVSSKDFYANGGEQLNSKYQNTSNFFTNLNQLQLTSSFTYLVDYGGSENSTYADNVLQSKNCYLSNTVIADCESVLYSYNVKDKSSQVLDSFLIWKNCENIIRSGSIISSFNIFYSHFIENSANIRFSSNLINCKDCFLCDGIENQQYCIKNIKYSKEEFLSLKESFIKEKNNYPERALWSKNHKGNNVACNNIIGENCHNCHNISNGYSCSNTKEGNNLIYVGGPNNIAEVYDVFSAGSGAGCSHIYGCFGTGLGAEHIYLCSNVTASSYIYYSTNIVDCSYCFGCFGLRNKSYCILNVQYTKEERYTKVDEIFTQMEHDGILGQFFPASMNPFYFNDTAAYLIDPSFTKEEVTAKGYLRRDDPIKVDIPADAKLVKSSDLEQFEKFDEQGNWTINADILKYVIQDELGNYYRIIPMEYKFLVKHGLPLPRKHWLERMKENFRIN